MMVSSVQKVVVRYVPAEAEGEERLGRIVAELQARAILRVVAEEMASPASRSLIEGKTGLKLLEGGNGQAKRKE